MSFFVFAGTHEGRELAMFLSERSIEATVLVATEYGETLLSSLPHITVRQGRLDAEQMERLFVAGDFVIDATHPYATQVTQNIKLATARADAIYWRLVREHSALDSSIILVPSSKAAATYLNTQTGVVLLTTGSKDLQAFTKVSRFAQRFWVRMLPAADAIQNCLALGYQNARIIAMQGPFSVEMNVAMLKMTQAKFLVTKDGGRTGGFEEKLRAAKACGTQVILIARPTAEQGYSLSQIKKMLSAWGQSVAHTDIPFPLFLKLSSCKVVILGGGAVAKRRADKLKAFGVIPTIIAPQGYGGLSLSHQRKAVCSDLEGADFVIAATDDRTVNHKISQFCRENHIFCSVADCVEESTAWFPAICEGNDLVCGMISLDGNHSKLSYYAEAVRGMLRKDEDTP